MALNPLGHVAAEVGALRRYSRGSERWRFCLYAGGGGCAFALLWAVRFRVVPILSIPSPGDPFLINSGPIHARWYGLLLAVGVLVAGWIARREFRRRSIDPELAYVIAVWAVPFGLVGARLYHVVTDWDSFRHDLSQVPAIWNGGLSIFGAVLGGMLGTWIGSRRAGLRFWVVADDRPGLILAQALGRWGNYSTRSSTASPPTSRGGD